MRQSKQNLTVIALLTLTSGLLLSGCAVNKTSDWVEPILVAESELSCMTDTTKRSILVHNETWETMK